MPERPVLDLVMAVRPLNDGRYVVLVNGYETVHFWQVADGTWRGEHVLIPEDQFDRLPTPEMARARAIRIALDHYLNVRKPARLLI